MIDRAVFNRTICCFPLQCFAVGGVRYTQFSDWICILVPQGRDELTPLAQRLGLGEVQHALRSAKDAGAEQLKKLFFLFCEGGEVESECCEWVQGGRNLDPDILSLYTSEFVSTGRFQLFVSGTKLTHKERPRGIPGFTELMSLSRIHGV